MLSKSSRNKNITSHKMFDENNGDALNLMRMRLLNNKKVVKISWKAIMQTYFIILNCSSYQLMSLALITWKITLLNIIYETWVLSSEILLVFKIAKIIDSYICLKHSLFIWSDIRLCMYKPINCILFLIFAKAITLPKSYWLDACLINAIEKNLFCLCPILHF